MGKWQTTILAGTLSPDLRGLAQSLYDENLRRTRRSLHSRASVGDLGGLILMILGLSRPVYSHVEQQEQQAQKEQATP